MQLMNYEVCVKIFHHTDKKLCIFANAVIRKKIASTRMNSFTFLQQIAM